MLALHNTQVLENDEVPVRGNNAENPTDFDQQEFERLVLAGFAAIESLDGREIVLLIGPAGVGKSTSINYLRGVVAGAPDAAAIGHTICSVTTLPVCYPDPTQGLTYLDSGLLFDIVGQEARQAISLTISAALQKVVAVKALVFVMGISEMQANRGQIFFKVAESIKKIVKNAAQYRLSIFFLFTKEADYDLEIYHKTLKKMLKDAQKAASPGNPYATVREVLTTVLEHFDQCCFTINPLDGGASAQNVIQALQQSTAIPRQDLGFVGDNGVQNSILRRMQTSAHTGLSLIRDSQQVFPSEIQAYQNEIQALDFNIDKEEKELRTLRAKTIPRTMASSHEITYIESTIRSLDDQIGSTQNRLNLAYNDAERADINKILQSLTQRRAAEVSKKNIVERMRCQVQKAQDATWDLNKRLHRKCIEQKEEKLAHLASERAKMQAKLQACQAALQEAESALSAKQAHHQLMQQMYPYLGRQEEAIEQLFASLS